MGDTRGELTHHGQLLGLLDLLGQGHAVRHVLDGEHRSHDLVRRPAKGAPTNVQDDTAATEGLVLEVAQFELARLVREQAAHLGAQTFRLQRGKRVEELSPQDLAFLDLVAIRHGAVPGPNALLRVHPDDAVGDALDHVPRVLALLEEPPTRLVQVPSQGVELPGQLADLVPPRDDDVLRRGPAGQGPDARHQLGQGRAHRTLNHQGDEDGEDERDGGQRAEEGVPITGEGLLHVPQAHRHLEGAQQFTVCREGNEVAPDRHLAQHFRLPRLLGEPEKGPKVFGAKGPIDRKQAPGVERVAGGIVHDHAEAPPLQGGSLQDLREICRAPALERLNHGNGERVGDPFHLRRSLPLVRLTLPAQCDRCQEDQDEEQREEDPERELGAEGHPRSSRQGSPKARQVFAAVVRPICPGSTPHSSASRSAIRGR